MTFRLLGEGGIIGGNAVRQIVLDLHTYGQRRMHPSAGQDWRGMLPELQHILQQCRMHLITEKKVGSQQIGDGQASEPACGCVVWVLNFVCINCKFLTVFVLVQCIIRATPFLLLHKQLRSDFVVF